MKKLLFKGDQLESVYPAGTYWNINNGKRLVLPEDVLSVGKWLRASELTVLMVGPIVGLVFAVFLPFIGIAMSINFVAKKFWDAVWPVMISASQFSWRPIEAYFNGRKRQKK